jgi:hypothetical protein
MKKRYERPVVVATYNAVELRAEAALVVASSYGGNDGGNNGGDWPRFP